MACPFLFCSARRAALKAVRETPPITSAAPTSEPMREIGEPVTRAMPAQFPIQPAPITAQVSGFVSS